MQMIRKVFPAFIGLFSFSIPAGVVVYFIVSNLWQVGQQAITFHKFPPATASDDAAPAKDAKARVKDTDGAKPSGTGKAGGKSPAAGANRTSGRAQPKAKAPAKGKRPPPSPRPKGLPASRSKPGQKGTSAKNTRRKDT